MLCHFLRALSFTGSSKSLFTHCWWNLTNFESCPFAILLIFLHQKKIAHLISTFKIISAKLCFLQFKGCKSISFFKISFSLVESWFSLLSRVIRKYRWGTAWLTIKVKNFPGLVRSLGLYSLASMKSMSDVTGNVFILFLQMLQLNFLIIFVNLLVM